MNKNLYRVIFNKARGMLMVVSETATSARGSPPSSQGLRPIQRRMCRLSALQFALLVALGCVSLASGAAVVADVQAPGHQQPTIINTANGTPQVNIQTPGSGGVSRNIYSQFDIDSKGVVLNNSHANTQTQLAGMVAGNGMLARGEARVILNEVNARNASQLNGMIEVAGQKAQVVIANPAGITCNGCGFINAHRATLTTGSVQMNQGLIAGFDVSNGEIVVRGAGMDSSRQDKTDLIARAVKINAGIWARELNVTAGRNLVDADHHRVTAKAADDSLAPALAIDVAALGGMYANKIRLTGTEKGVGVHNAGHIGTAAGDVVINADGRIGNSGSINASQNLRLTSQGQMDNSGRIYAAASTDVTASGTLNNSGIIAASNHSTLNAASLVSHAGAVLAAGINSDGRPGTAGNLTLSSLGELRVHGQAFAAGQLTATGTTLDLSGSLTTGRNMALQARSGSLTTSNASLTAAQQITASARTAINNHGGILSADAFNLSASTFSNQQGRLQQLGTDDLHLSFTGGLNNSDGIIASNGLNLTLNTSSFSNQHGTLQHYGTGDLTISSTDVNSTRGRLNTQGRLNLGASQLVLDEARVEANQLSITADSLSHRGGNMVQTGRGDLSVTVNARLDNQQGSMATNGNLLLNAGSLNNQQGHLIAAQRGAIRIETQSLLDNQQGSMAAAGSLSLHSSGLNNAGGLLQSGAEMTVALAGDLINRDSGSNGGILSRGSMIVSSGNIDNTAGFIAAGGDASLTGWRLSNQQGTLTSDAGLKLVTHAVNNHSGRVQARTRLDLNTGGNILTNTRGVFSAGETLTLLTGALLNASGQLISTGTLKLNTLYKQLDNHGGMVASAGDMQLDTGMLSNTGGQLQAAGNAQINTADAGIDNTSGLIRSGRSLSLTTAMLSNRNTLSGDTGIEGQRVTITSASTDNLAGAIRANDRLDIASSHALNNSGGLISSASRLNIDGGQSLTLINTAGTLTGGGVLSLTANALSGDGRVASQDGMTLDLQQAFFNQGELTTNGDMNFTLGSTLVNQSLIRAGGVLTLHATELDNQEVAEISAGENHLLIAGAVTNRGLLDGGLTHVTASILSNTGSGRIYGHRVALQSATLNNRAENGRAATIAARERLDIGAGEVNNADHGVIYSAGDIAVGGTLNASWRASGRGGAFNNHSATLEAVGDITLDIREINNINDHLVTEVVEVEHSSHHEGVLKGSINRFDWADIDLSYKNKYGVRDAIMPDGTRDNDFYEYQYQRTITETRVKESDPGQLIAGGNLTLNSDRVNNHDSRIVAGGLLGGIIGELNNIATTGKRVITDIGTQTRWYAKKSGSGMGGTSTSQGRDRSNYRPDAIFQTVDLHTMAWQGNTAIGPGKRPVAERDNSGSDITVIHAGDITADTGQIPLNPPPGQLVEIVQPDSDDTLIRTIVPDLTLPDNSLYQQIPGNDVPFLIETDPRFTDKKRWLGSDYMQTWFTQDPNNTLKRLGDGFYEQQLIRQQVVALTGSRYLSGHSSDEAQFQALMDAGITFGKAFGLKIGVALTAQQMAQLTSDMVWLVKQSVTLADGSTQEVLVPQLYARLKSGDLDGSGALLAGNNLSLNVNSDLTNSGLLYGRETAQLSADNLLNSGFIGGDNVALRARTDIDNIGGTVRAGSSLSATAGRDINSISTAAGSTGNITFDRPAVIYV